MSLVFKGITNTKENSRRDEEGDEEQKVPLQGAPKDPLHVSIGVVAMKNIDIILAIQILTQALREQVNKEVQLCLIKITWMAAPRMIVFLRMILFEFLSPRWRRIKMDA